MVTRLTDGVGKEADTITAEVLIKVESDLELCRRLLRRFGSHALDALHEEVENLWIVHALYHLSVDFTEHKVAIFVLERVVKACLRTLLQTLYEGINLIHLRVRNLDHGAAFERVNEVSVLACRDPFAANEIETLVCARKVVRVNSREGLQVLRHSTMLNAIEDAV